MKISVYSTAWSVVSKKFDYKGALDNWATFSDEIVIAVPNSDTEGTRDLIAQYAGERGYTLTIQGTDFDLSGKDPFAYGKTENAAVQACTGDFLWQQNLDERTLVRDGKLAELSSILRMHSVFGFGPRPQAFWIPTIDLYGSNRKFLPPVKKKWYGHARGLFRGAVKQGIKADGHPDYNVTSTDELLDKDGNLVMALSVLQDYSLDGLKEYVAAGWPLVYHLGYLDFNERLDRSIWWKEYWVKATNGDSNQHPTTIEAMASQEAQEHRLPLWTTKQ